LIRDSLLAALDELGMPRQRDGFSVLTGRLEPGALAPSNIPSMVIYHGSCDWSCKRGCIAETLSALVLAVEVDNAARLDGVYSLLADKTKTIALEEPTLVSGVAYYSLGMQHR
jgi:hypothetical protein